MSKFTFINEQFDYDEYTGEQRNLVSKTTREFHGHTLDGVLDEMTAFLRGAGYHFDGHLDVVSYESEINKIDDELDDLKEEIRSQRVFDHIVKDLSTNPIKMDENLTFTIAGANDFSDDQYNLNFETMAGAQPIYTVDIDTESLGEINFSLDSVEKVNLELTEYCEVCHLPKSVMQSHKCYDEKCPVKVS
jgi:hypothetical protein